MTTRTLNNLIRHRDTPTQRGQASRPSLQKQGGPQDTLTFKLHLARGLAGIAALSAALYFAELIWPAIILMPFALWMFRGCPFCWTTGLFEMAALRFFGRQVEEPE
jgi:hypothetical protein